MQPQLALLVSAYMALSNLGEESPLHNESIKLGKKEWQAYKLEYNKTYENDVVSSLRKVIYLNNKRIVDKFNREDPKARHYQLEVNELADRTDEELDKLRGFRIRQQFGGGGTVIRNTEAGLKFLREILGNNEEVPDELDWTKVDGVVTNVKFQGECGSCWTFAATGALEGQMQKRSGANLQTLSEQQLLDCAGFGCEGGITAVAFEHIAEHGGIQSGLSYPYEGLNSTCRFSPEMIIMTDVGFVNLPPNDEELLRKVVAKFGPVSSAINLTRRMKLYKQGVYSEDDCPNTWDALNHAILIVGYGKDPISGDYWLIKNSYGSWWGDRGYMRLARNQNSMCGIAVLPTIPTF